MNKIKDVIQKEEYIAIAINKYILQTATIPKKDDNTLDWDKLMKDDYLGVNFNKKNSLTSNDIKVNFDSKNNVFILGSLEEEAQYKTDNNYLYDFYINKIYRVNTISPLNKTKEKLLIGSQIIYSSTQKEIVSLITQNDTNKKIKLSTQNCESGKYFYELRDNELTYKYCKTPTYPITVYQDAPIYLENWEDLEFVKGNIGDKAYVKKNGSWYEYYYQGDSTTKWIPQGMGDVLTSVDENLDLEDRILSYIPDSKDLVLRRDGGCMLANGDIFCWGNNKYKKVGIESSGQIDNRISADYVNTPVMLKVQISDAEQKLKNWYNNPYRIKFEKMSMNSSNVCGISPIFNYFDGVQKKFGGDLYCNGQITSSSFEDMDVTKSESAILKRNIFFYNGKSDELENSNEIYLTDIVMIEDVIAVLSDAGKIYTFGRNYKGALGIGSDDKFIIQTSPIEIKNNGQVFKKIFALRDIKGFGAIDNNNLFYIWGERPNGKIYNEITELKDSIQFNPDAIFTNSKDFILKGVNNVFYRTSGDRDFYALTQIPSSAVSASIYDSNGSELYLYINEDLELKGTSSLLTCRESSSSSCSSTNDNIFNWAFEELNKKSNTVNGKDYANFANISIFQLDHNIEERSENFESSASGWSDNKRTIVTNDGTDQIPVTNFLGNFSIGTTINKTFSFGSSYANNEVEVEFDFYEIDTWDFERFTTKLNGEIFVEDNFIHDDHPYLTDVNDTGEALQKVISSGSVNNDNDEKYHYKLKTKLDSSGNIKIEFSTRGLTASDYGYNGWSYAQDINDESWGIDNVKVKLKETNKTFVCAMTGFGSASQMYCWGNVARTIPILSTSLYDMSKISTINKLFITQESEKQNQMSYSDFYYGGKLWLKFPTYIGGFDYPFYFK